MLSLCKLLTMNETEAQAVLCNGLLALHQDDYNNFSLHQLYMLFSDSARVSEMVLCQDHLCMMHTGY